MYALRETKCSWSFLKALYFNTIEYIVFIVFIVLKNNVYIIFSYIFDNVYFVLE